MMKIKIAETAQKHGLKSAYALQKALNISPTMASRLWKGEFDKIGINTLEKLCDYFQCQTNELLEYPLTLSSNTESSKNVERATQLSNTQTSKAENAADVLRRLKENAPVVALSPAEVFEQLKEKDSGKVFNNSVLDIVQSSSDNEFNLTTAAAGELLGLKPRTVRENAEKGLLPGKQGKQNHWFFRRSDIDGFISRRG
jgi:DNA-binding Xre family transcriptional regulator